MRGLQFRLHRAEVRARDTPTRPDVDERGGPRLPGVPTNADTQNLPLGPDAEADAPKPRLYRSTVAEAMSSMKSAGKS